MPTYLWILGLIPAARCWTSLQPTSSGNTECQCKKQRKQQSVKHSCRGESGEKVNATGS